jgi:phosphatidylinositol 4-phosphatase
MDHTSAAMKRSLDTYPALRMQRLGHIVVIQPWWQGSVAGLSLTCDLEAGTTVQAEHPPIEKNFTPVFGVLGMLRLESGPALVVISAVEEVAKLRGHPLLRIMHTQILAQGGGKSQWKAQNDRLLELLRKGTDPGFYGGSLYFAAGGDPTLTQQRYEAAAAKPEHATSWSRADPDYCWNRFLAKPLLDAGLERFVPTVFVGFVAQLSDLDFSRGARQCHATLTLIARRSSRRVGTRQWRRGADLEAHVANFVESEQLMEFRGTDSNVHASFVQVRGSVPLLWSQAPNLKYKIPIHIAAPSKTEPVVAFHFGQLAQRYGQVTAINLANQTGREGRLSAAYASAAARAVSKVPACRLVPFDFHKHCGATNYANLALLWREVEQDFAQSGYWLRDGDGNASSIQRGVFRTNCIDTLDRTNVVQGLLARRQLESELHRQGLLADGELLAGVFPQAEVAFRVAWADHGDEISRQYAGTGAMKSAFTRTGKRDIAGLLDDGAKSLTRYFLNNFRDGEKQDALDLVTGTYRVEPGRAVPKAARASPALPLLLAVLLFIVSLTNAKTLTAGGQLSFGSGFSKVLMPALLAIVILKLVFAFGSKLVDRPSLRPDLCSPWRLR